MVRSLSHTTFDRSGHRAPHWSFKFRACLRGQSAVISSDHSNSLASRPQRIISRSTRYWPERPHLSQVMRSTVSLPTMSRKMIAPSRGITTTPQPATRAPSAPLRPQRLSAFPSLQPSATAQPQALQVWGGTAPACNRWEECFWPSLDGYCGAGTVLGRRAPRCTVPRPPGWLLTTPCAPPWLPAPKLGPAPAPATPPGTPPSIADAAVFGNTIAINEMHAATEVIL